MSLLFFRLLRCDLRTRIRMFLAFAGAAVLGGASFGIILGPAAAMPFLVSFVAWCYCGRTAGDDDKADMWPFLGALPIPARVTTGVQYASGLAATLLYTILVALVILITALVRGEPPVLAPSSALTGLVFFSWETRAHLVGPQDTPHATTWVLA